MIVLIGGFECFQQIVIDVFSLDSLTHSEVLLVEGVVLLNVVGSGLLEIVMLLVEFLTLVDQLALSHALLIF